MKLDVFAVQELMFCYVITPSDMTEDMLSSPECLKQFTVQVRQHTKVCFESFLNMSGAIIVFYVAGSHREQMGLLKRANWTGGNLTFLFPCLFCFKILSCYLFFFSNIQRLCLNNVQTQVQECCKVFPGNRFLKKLYKSGISVHNSTD